MRLELLLNDPWLQMTISDNGVGISDIDVQGSKSFGLMGMRERAHIFGGTVSITGKEGEGTAVTARLPLKQPIK